MLLASIDCMTPSDGSETTTDSIFNIEYLIWLCHRQGQDMGLGLGLRLGPGLGLGLGLGLGDITKLLEQSKYITT